MSTALSLLDSLLLKPPVVAPKPKPVFDDAKLEEYLAKQTRRNVNAHTAKGPRGNIHRYTNTNNGKNGFVRIRFTPGTSVEQLAYMKSMPLFTSPQIEGEGVVPFSVAPDGIYTWILVYPLEDAAATPIFAATLVRSKMEIGAGHAETIERVNDLLRGSAWSKAYPGSRFTSMDIRYAGELIKEGARISINLLSGSYMLPAIVEIAGKYDFEGYRRFIKRDESNASPITSDEKIQFLNNLYIARAQTALRPLGINVLFTIEGGTLITHESVPLKKDELLNYVSRGFANVNYTTSSTPRTSATVWTPYIYRDAAAAAAAGAADTNDVRMGAGAAATGTSRRRRTTRRRRRR